MRFRRALEVLIAGAGLWGLVLGIRALVDEEGVGASWAGAWDGIASQLGTTVPAVLIVLLVSVVNLFVGAIVLRIVRDAPYESWGDAAVHGLAGAIAFDLVLLAVLGSLGGLSTVVIAIALTASMVFGVRRARPFLARAERSSTDDVDGPFIGGGPLVAGAWWALVAAVWMAPVIVMLASPVAAVPDVLPNHIAPVEHIRVYESFPSLDVVPAPNYGPSRQILGYVALLGAITKLTDRPAALTASAFVLPLVILVAISSVRFAVRIFGKRAGPWALLTIPLTFSFLRLPDSRGTVLAVPLLFFGLSPDLSLSPRRRDAVTVVALGTLVYVHPALGALALLTYLAMAALIPGAENKLGIAGPIAAAVGSVPQVLTMAGASLPSWTIIIAALAASGVITVASGRRVPIRSIARWLLVAVGVLALVRISQVLGEAGNFASFLARNSPLLVAGFVAAILLRGTRKQTLPLLVSLGVSAAAAVAVTLLPGGDALWQGVRDEVGGKALRYWSPLFLAIGAAGAMSVLWTYAKAHPAAYVLVAAVVLVAVLPIRQDDAGPHDNKEHRLSEQLSIAMNKAEGGAFRNWPDPRHVIGPSQKDLVDALRREQQAGRLTEDDRVLHVASSYQSWVSTPISAFAGVIETSLSNDPDSSPNALHGRLFRLSSLRPRFDLIYRYVLLEPQGLSGEFRERIVDAGYRSVFTNVRGELFVRESA
ncbi:MAG: hypothetical protein WD646_06110 [Actinomycetota bacterium]